MKSKGSRPLLDREARERAILSIRRYFSEHLDDEIGELKAGLLLDFVLEEIGASVYNFAIRDAQAYFQDQVADLDGSCYRQEFDYWKTKR